MSEQRTIEQRCGFLMHNHYPCQKPPGHEGAHEWKPHVHTDECWEPDSGCDMGRNEKYAERVPMEECFDCMSGTGPCPKHGGNRSSKEEVCPHDWHQSVDAVETDGLCPLCLVKKVERLTAELQVMSDKFILEGRMPVPVDLMTWARWFESADRVVAKSEVGDARVSTVFLGVDHSWGEGPPLLFETMIFGGPHDEYQNRCSTWEQAEAMHAEAVRLAEGKSGE